MKFILFKSLIFLVLYPNASGAVRGSGGGSGASVNCPGGGKADYDVESHLNNAHGAAFALLDYLDEFAEEAAVVGRAGDDISGYKYRNPRVQKYTHAGVVYKNEDGNWRFKHVLNICRGPTSGIFDQSLLEFFDDTPYLYDFRIIVPSAELQKKIRAVIEDEALINDLHNPAYNMIARPGSSVDQNSNGWVLSVVTAADFGYRSPERILSNLQITGYLPSQVKVSFGGLVSFFKDNATTKHHSEEEKGSGWYSFVSVASLFQHINMMNMPDADAEICHPEGCNIPSADLNKQTKKQSRREFDPLRDGK